jgi:signal transduction histidine kinase
VDVPNEELCTLADANALRRVICSLIENSIKYTPDGGHIRLAAKSEGDEIAIRISDTGCGIEASDVPYVFEKFYRGRPSRPDDYDSGTEAPGVGLGLYLARSIIQEFGGRIDVEASTNRGTTLAVYLSMFPKDKEIKEDQFVETSTHC